MTGYSRNAVVHQGRLDEGVDLLQKPVSQAQLAMRVRAALDRKDQNDVRFWHSSGHTNGHCKCPLLTQSGQAGLAVDGNEDARIS